ncbi:MAG: M56 family metallopeptidase, partial [Bacteroidales bacterium]
SLWQGTLIGLLLFVSLVLLKRASSHIRYYISFAALLMMVIFSGITFGEALSQAKEKEELRLALISRPEYLAEYIKNNGFSDPEEALSAWNSFSFKRAVRRAKIQRHFSWIVGLWLTGLVFYFLKTGYDLISQYRIRKTGRQEPDRKWMIKMHRFADRLKIKKRVSIYLSHVVRSPATTGFLKPIILIPASLFSGLDPEQLEAIIAHELAHIKRNDYIINILQTFIETIFFFHPAAWYISAQIRKEREHACDDIAIELTGDKVNYARALANAQDFVVHQGNLALTFSPFRQSLLKRIKRLNTKINMKTNVSEKLMAGLIILSGFVFLSFIVDGNYSQFKHAMVAEEANIDSTAPPKKLVIRNTSADKAEEKVIKEHIYKAREEELDSLIAELEDHGEISREIEKVIELAMVEESEMLEEEILHTIQIVLEDIDIDAIVDGSLSAVRIAGEEVTAALENENIRMKICQAIDEDLSDSLDIETQIMVKEALEEVCMELEDMDIHVIVADALEEAGKALQEIDMEIVIHDALEQAAREMEEERRYVVEVRKELEEEEKADLEEQKQKLIEKEEELKNKLQELEDEIREIKKRQKEEARSGKE